MNLILAKFNSGLSAFLQTFGSWRLFKDHFTKIIGKFKVSF